MSPAALGPSSGHFGHLAMTHSHNYQRHYFMTSQRVAQPYLDNTCCTYPLFFWFTVRNKRGCCAAAPSVVRLRRSTCFPILPSSRQQKSAEYPPLTWSWVCDDVTAVTRLFTEDEHSEVTSLLLFIWQTAWDSLSFQCTVYCLDTIVNQHILFDNQYFFLHITAYKYSWSFWQNYTFLFDT